MLPARLIRRREQHSVSQQPRIVIGYKEIKLSTVTDTALLLTASEVEGIIGRPYDNQRDAVMVMNAYGNITATGASPLHLWQAEWWSDGVRVYLSRDFGASTIRFAYVMFIGN